MTGLSRRKAGEAILKKRVRVDGKIETYPRREIEPDVSKVFLDGRLLKYSQEAKVVYLLNKPSGYLSAMSDDRNRKTIADLIEGKIRERVFHVGRLDQGTRGLILLTNDGELANLVTHPSSQIEKVYLVKIAGRLENFELQAIREGIKLEDGFITAPAKITVSKSYKDETTFRLTLQEGHKREIREMFKTFNKKVLELVRVSIGGLDLSLVPRPGDIKKLNKKEIESIKKGTR